MSGQHTIDEQLGTLFHLIAMARMQNGLENNPLRNSAKGQGRILAFLNLKDGVSTKNLATVLDLRVSSLNEMLSKLEADGYITRKPCPTDGRVSLIYLTEKGRESDPAVMASIDPLEFLSPAEQDQLQDLLAKMISGLESTLDSGALARLKAEHDRRHEVLRSLFTDPDSPDAVRPPLGFSPDAWSARFGSLPFRRGRNRGTADPAPSSDIQ